jgi:hypothetical protein
VSTISITIAVFPILYENFVRPQGAWVNTSPVHGPIFDFENQALLITADNVGKQPAVLMSLQFNVLLPYADAPNSRFLWQAMEAPEIKLSGEGDTNLLDGRTIPIKVNELKIIQITKISKADGRGIRIMLDELSREYDPKDLKCYFSFEQLPPKNQVNQLGNYFRTLEPMIDNIPRAYEVVDGRVFSEISCYEARFWSESQEKPLKLQGN